MDPEEETGQKKVKLQIPVPALYTSWLGLCVKIYSFLALGEAAIKRLKEASNVSASCKQKELWIGFLGPQEMLGWGSGRVGLPLEKEECAAVGCDEAVTGKILYLSCKCLVFALLSHSKERPDRWGLFYFFFNSISSILLPSLRWSGF